MKQAKTEKQNFTPFHHINFSKASPEAIDAILNALNAEVDEAMQANRTPLLDRAFGRLCPAVNTSIMM